VSQLRIVTAQAVVSTDIGEAIATFHQMALLGKGKSILSCLQMEAHGAYYINNCSRYYLVENNASSLRQETKPIDDHDGPTSTTEGNNALIAYMVAKQSPS
jgi:hypothetical protein